jgi:hypothetical protein
MKTWRYHLGPLLCEIDKPRVFTFNFIEEHCHNFRGIGQLDQSCA